MLKQLRRVAPEFGFAGVPGQSRRRVYGGPKYPGTPTVSTFSQRSRHRFSNPYSTREVPKNYSSQSSAVLLAAVLSPILAGTLFYLHQKATVYYSEGQTQYATREEMGKV
jgi:hypothetical protein